MNNLRHVSSIWLLSIGRPNLKCFSEILRGYLFLQILRLRGPLCILFGHYKLCHEIDLICGYQIMDNIFLCDA